MGNQAFKDYIIIKETGSSNPWWKIYDATKKSTNEQISLFVFEKKSVEKHDKAQKKAISELLHKEVFYSNAYQIKDL